MKIHFSNKMKIYWFIYSTENLNIKLALKFECKSFWYGIYILKSVEEVHKCACNFQGRLKIVTKI